MRLAILGGNCGGSGKGTARKGISLRLLSRYRIVIQVFDREWIL